jgi:hypothetical protein
MENLDILKKLLLQEEDNDAERMETAPKTFEDDPMNFILNKYQNLSEVLTYLMSEDFKELLTGIYILAYKPTQFKIVLHNGQYFFLTFMGEAYQATVSGKNYFLLNTGEKQRAMLAVSRLLRWGSPLKVKGPEGAEQGGESGTEDTGIETPPAESSETGGEETGEETETLEESKKKIELEVLEILFNSKKTLLEAKKTTNNITQEEADTILKSPAYKKINIVKTSIDKNNIIVYASDISKKDRSNILQNIAKDTKGKYVQSKESTAGAVQNSINGKPYIVTLKVTSEEKTDTDLKEGMSVVLANVPNLSPATTKNVESIINNMIKETDNSEGLSKITKDKIKSYLTTIKGRLKNNPALSTKVCNILNENISQASSFQIFLKKNPNFRIERGQMKDELFTKIRNAGAKITNLPADKWCPGDIYFIRKGSESSIDSIIKNALSTENKESALSMLNGMFSPIENFSSRVDKNHNVVAVSLKQSSAQGGKLKSVFQQYEGTKKDYNISPEEMSLPDKKLGDLITKMRNDLKSAIKAEPSTEYIYNPCDIKSIKDHKKLLGKFGAYKALEYIMKYIAKKGDNLDDALVGITAYGFGIVKKDNIPINPPFLKLIASSKGLATEPQYFEPGRTVRLMSLNGAPKPSQIQIVDGPDYGGIAIYLTLALQGLSKRGEEEKIKYEVNFRYNGGDQLTIELGNPKHIN